MQGVFCTKEVTWDLDRGPESVAARLGDLLPGSRIICLKQVHSNEIIWAEDIAPDEFPEADGVISHDPGVVLCIRTADCVPVLLWADDSPIIAAVHAGWRGLALRIVEKTIGLMRASGVGNINVGMGPSIGPCCYAVGQEVITALEADSCQTLDGRHSVDLHYIAAVQAQNAGVLPERIFQIHSCTCCNKDLFFSYRRDGEHTGRNISLIGGASCSLPGLQAR